MATNEFRTYTAADLENAKTKGQVIGWIQGGVVAIVLWFGMGLIGLIPMLVLAAVVVLLLYFGMKR